MIATIFKSPESMYITYPQSFNYLSATLHDVVLRTVLMMQIN